MVEQEDLSKIGEILWEFLTDEVPESTEPSEFDVVQESLDAIHDAGMEGITAEDLQYAIEQLGDSMTAQQQAQLQPLREAIANQPEPVIQQIIQEAADPVTVVRNVTQVTNVTNVDEGDQFVDQSVNTTILAEGDVDFDQQIANNANIADDGAVLIDGDVDGAAINTGNFDGVQGGGDIAIEDSAIGDANVLVNDSEFDALAVGGDATNVEAGGDANVGSGTQVGIDAGGDVNSAFGDANDFTGDQTANVNAAPQPAEEPAFDSGIEDALELEAQALDQGIDDAAFELDG